ncbi:MAG: histidinol-phosphatase HisJ family protein [Chloroflexi bacterium]|nr:histidinol-phosphatase HisJ family protein [Chloroflexota bacterium]
MSPDTGPDPGDEPGEDPQARDLPLDAHLHTDQSPDSRVPIDVYAAMAEARGITELAITDHVDFDARDPAYDYVAFADRERTVRDAAERWAPRGVLIRFGAELTYNASWEADVRDHLRRHRYDYTIGSVHDWPDSPYVPSRIRTWIAGRPVEEIVAPYFEQVVGAARSGLFDTIGHLDNVKRYLAPEIGAAELAARPELLDAPLAALVESGTALEVNTSGLRHRVGETYPAPWAVARYRELGGTRVVAGSDAHRPEWFAWGLEAGYRVLADAGFEGLTFRRGAEPVSIALPARMRHVGGHGPPT